MIGLLNINRKYMEGLRSLSNHQQSLPETPKPLEITSTPPKRKRLITKAAAEGNPTTPRIVPPSPSSTSRTAPALTDRVTKHRKKRQKITPSATKKTAASVKPRASATSKKLVFDLSKKNIRVLKETHFKAYNNQSTVDLSENPFHYVPKWFRKHPTVQTLIVSNSTSKFGLTFEEGFPKDITVEAYGMDVRCPLEGLSPQQLKCEIDFSSSSDYWDRLTQPASVEL
jgi:hypothetical protein